LAGRHSFKIVHAVFAATAICGSVFASPTTELTEKYLDEYFRMFPTRATAAGRHEFDGALEDFSKSKIEAWIKFNQATRAKLFDVAKSAELTPDDRLDAETLHNQIDRELNDLTVLRRADRDPLYWSSVVADAVVFLLVRDDLPLAQRQQHARARARSFPRFVQAACQHFANANDVPADFCRIAAGQVRSLAQFYQQGFSDAVGGAADSKREAETAASALLAFAQTLEDLQKRANGSPRLGANYESTFHLGTAVTQPVSAVLSRATADLAATRTEAAAYGRQIWSQFIPNEPAPASDVDVLRRLFDRVAADHNQTVDDALEQWRGNVTALNTLVHERKIMTLPDPLTLIVDRSPSYFVGQSVGGVYAAGPYSPDAKTILFIPAPSHSATADQRAAFFRDFNEHFNKMIVPHELIPGHYVQFKIAAHQPHKIRTVFPNGVYVEGWGTFCERVLLDEGWGGPLERMAHLKKQLENTARAIVDIRVHTQNMSRDEVLHFVKDEALQDDQFASNMWTRALTSSPQITTYYLGYHQLRQIYESARAAEGDQFELRRFMDGMMDLGPVSLDHYMQRFARGHSPPPSKAIPSPAK
jgi:uncharacterized protein (DUF885 family)